ncbi:phosphotransferase family protein [Nocardia carnea]|uniref:phosphotransferase family protein n=1 Tax=Nocardia carnea TaxID=37328 RepID=UPI0024574CCC|nr:phosphotransferase [Nocardia carnea]
MSVVHDILDTACRRAGIDHRGAHLIHHSSNAVVVLPAHPAVARICLADPDPARTQLTHHLTDWLTGTREFGATAPLPGLDPIHVDGSSVGFWTLYPQPSGPPPTSAHLARLLRHLHNTPAPAHLNLPHWTPLESLHAALTNTDTTAITDSERTHLLDRIADVRQAFAGLDWPLGQGLIHGDAWAGNLLWDTSADPPQPILGDWDWAAIGPREIDLIPTWHAARRYGRDQHWINEFIAHYGFDLTTAPHFPLLLEMRDLVQISGPLRRANDSPDHAARLRQRVDDIIAHRTSTSWAQYR